ncbi:Cap15 family CBASS effector [Klebsiella quasipneumoniae]|uniref:Cap15 family CBASS effector n=1 Tax=Klebsiella quasipneumoniae TaxID=1463165 RepID=UPI00197C2818|nr:hypothetical protein [Klebsiella quasipneumoniae]ELT0945192.1 hypothetical protein [Klebsiella quasipneumoniae]MCJ4453023.1 hypothetical protein [Klebsiella quasipneumoniae]QSI12431.1 hypothetical protein FA956_11905 [Klebsiella quasipneumoniae]
MKSHEYIVISGFNRSKVGKIIGSLASLISGVLVFLILTYLENNSYIEMKSVMTPTVSSLISAGTMYLILYWIFDSRLWKWKLISKVINVPNLSGEWDCEGRGENKEGDVFFGVLKLKYSSHGIKFIYGCKPRSQVLTA